MKECSGTAHRRDLYADGKGGTKGDTGTYLIDLAQKIAQVLDYSWKVDVAITYKVRGY